MEYWANGGKCLCQIKMAVDKICIVTR